jgi:hypothetical protein
VYSTDECRLYRTNPSQMFLLVHQTMGFVYKLFYAYLGMWYFGRIVTLGSYY